MSSKESVMRSLIDTLEMISEEAGHDADTRCKYIVGWLTEYACGGYMSLAKLQEEHDKASQVLRETMKRNQEARALGFQNAKAAM